MRCFAIPFLVIAVGTAVAEPRRTTEAVTLRKKPGEREAVVGQVPAGTEVTIVSEDGRWLKIRVNKLEGYVARTTITEAVAAPVDAAPVWGVEGQAPGGALTVVVQAPIAMLRSSKGDTAPTVAQLGRTMKLVVLDAVTDPRWVQVRDEQGHTGWIDRADLGNGAGSVAVTGGELKATAQTVVVVRRSQTNLVVRTDLGFGYRALGMDLTANATGGLTNYILDADAMAATLSVDVVDRLSNRFFVAFDGSGQVSEASPGVTYNGPSSPSGTIPFKTFATDLGAAIGVHAKEVFDLSLRAGFHYDAFLADAVDNVGMLPRERLAGATLGIRVAIAPPTSRFDVTLRFDALVIGSRSQTAGLEDGTSSTAHGLWGGLKVRAQLSGRWSLFGAYELGRATTHWTGMSEREPGVTDTSRVDSTQLVHVGVSVSL